MSSRREFITLLGGAAAGWPLSARAQQAGKLPIDYAFDHEPMDRRFCRAAARTWLDRGSNHQDRVWWAEGRGERYADIAAEFVRLKVDVIVTTGPAAPQAKKATSIIP